jgi:hypothetical protein
MDGVAVRHGDVEVVRGSPDPDVAAVVPHARPAQATITAKAISGPCWMVRERNIGVPPVRSRRRST